MRHLHTIKLCIQDQYLHLDHLHILRIKEAQVNACDTQYVTFPTPELVLFTVTDCVIPDKYDLNQLIDLTLIT